MRKGGGEPYIVHPFQVALMLVDLGAPSTTVQAGLLHDVVEDCDEWTIERVHIEFGEVVASTVAEVTEDKSRTWAERKQHAIDIVPALSDGALLVKACDKLQNLQSLARLLAEADDAAQVWSGFRGGRDATLRMDAGLVRALVGRVEERLARSLHAALEAVREA